MLKKECPKVFNQTLAFYQEQYSECVYDKDTDEMIWYPGMIDQCNRK